MTVDGNRERDLSELRRRLDQLDERLVELLALRGDVIDEVIHFKKRHELSAVDPLREDQMLSRIEGVASSKGLDPRVARQVLRTVIDAFTVLEVEALADDP